MHNDKATIGNIKREDLEEIIKLGSATEELCVEAENPEYYSREQLENFITSPNDIYLVAKMAGEMMGYLLATYNPFLREAYFIDIAIKEKYRGRGIGKLLYRKTLEILGERGCKWAWALIHEDNRRMMVFSEKQKFLKGKKFFVYYRRF